MVASQRVGRPCARAHRRPRRQSFRHRVLALGWLHGLRLNHGAADLMPAVSASRVHNQSHTSGLTNRVPHLPREASKSSPRTLDARMARNVEIKARVSNEEAMRQKAAA